jgi:predicted MFS family arabinose efflux permease
LSGRKPVFGILLALWLMVLASSSQVMIIAPILPRIATAMDIPPGLQGVLVSGYALALAAFALVVGPISDRVGRRRVLACGTGAMAVVLLLHGLADDFGTLLAVRILAGAAGGILTGSAVSYVGDYFPYERRGWANGWVMSGFAVGQIIGVPIGTILAARYGFAAPFLLFAGLMAVSFALVLLRVPQPEVQRARRLTLASALTGYAGLLRQRPVVVAALAYATMFFAVATFTTFIPSWAEAELGVIPDEIAIWFAVGGVASVLAGPQAGRLSDRFGRKPLIVCSCVGTATFFGVASFAIGGFATGAVFFFLIMTLVAMRLAPFQALLSALVPDQSRGSLLSLVVSTGQVGGGLGGAVAGLAYQHSGFLGCTLLAATSIALTGLLVAYGLPEPHARTRPSTTPPASAQAGTKQAPTSS